MKKFLSISLTLVMLVVLVGCGGSSGGVSQEEYDKIVKERDALQGQLNSLHTDQNNGETETPTVPPEETPEKTQGSEADVLVTFTDKVNIPEDIQNGRFSNRVEFKITATNKTDKEVKGIQGQVDIQDMFGVRILRLNCDLTGESILAGGTASYDTLGFDVNQFMDNHTKVYATNFQDLLFVYKVHSIVFADGTTNTY